jgi:hypothetical protein
LERLRRHEAHLTGKIGREGRVRATITVVVPKMSSMLCLLAGCSVAGSGATAAPSTAASADARSAHGAPGATCDDCLSIPLDLPPAPASRIDTTSLAEAFAEVGYLPPDGAHLLVGREIDGAPTEFEWFSLGETGLVPSQGHYWPASTVKLIAAVAALETLGEHGLTGASTLSFTDDDGPYFGSARELARLAVQVSDNPSYNRTVLIAGVDDLNERILPSWGLGQTRLQRRFTRPDGVVDLSLRRSPEIRYREGDRTGVLPARTSHRRYEDCPADGNCTTLFELLLVMRRLTLHRELPESERFRLSDADVDALMDALRASRTRLGLGAAAALGDVVVYNKTGTVPGDDRLDHGLIVDRLTGRRYLVALALPWASTENDDAEELTRQALTVVR